MLVRDRLYGSFDLTLGGEVLDLAPVSRLRGISLSNVPPRILSKVGFSENISNRLEHSLGVAHLAQYHDEDLVYAALFHDAGLPPFSHMVEHLMREDHEARSARLAWDLGYSRASTILSGKHHLSWMISSGIDLDNADNVARFLVTGLASSPSYDPIRLAKSMDPGRGCFLDTSIVKNWLVDRKRLYSRLFGWANLAPHSVMTSLLEDMLIEGILDEAFFDMTDEEGIAMLLRHRRRRMNALLSGHFPREVLRLEGLESLDWETRFGLEREIEGRLGRERFSVFVFSGRSKEDRKLRIKTCDGSLLEFGRESPTLTVVFTYFRPSGEELKLIRGCIESGC